MCIINKYTNTRMYVCTAAVYMALNFATPWPPHTSFVSQLGHPSKIVLDTPLCVVSVVRLHWLQIFGCEGSWCTHADWCRRLNHATETNLWQRQIFRMIILQSDCCYNLRLPTNQQEGSMGDAFMGSGSWTSSSQHNCAEMHTVWKEIAIPIAALSHVKFISS